MTRRSPNLEQDSRPPPPSTARRATWRLDVSDAVPLPGRFEIAVDVVVPANFSVDPARPIFCCLPGGFLSRRYFDLGNNEDRRFSFAEAMAKEGFITLAFDHLGVGESSKPDPIEGGYALGVEDIAIANQCALDLALARLGAGDPSLGLPPSSITSDASHASDTSDTSDAPRAPTIGVGHSMGSMLTIEQQSIARPHRALLLFSFSTRGTPAFLNEAMREYANQPERLRREIGDLARRSMGSPYPERANNSEADRRAAFGVGTAPALAVEALDAASTNLLAVGGLMSMVPAGYAPPALEINVPVFMLIGDHDLHDDRHTRADLPRSPNVTTQVLDDCWHCHFVANTRATIWQCAASWAREILDT
jgi:pimeloyl-ACP methyl ester carboxylesterase